MTSRRVLRLVERVLRRVAVSLTLWWLRTLYRRRILPLPAVWGWERGTPVDRHYIANFIRAHAAEVRGRVLEFGLPDYREFFDPAGIERYDIMDTTRWGDHITVVGDIQHVPHLPDASYDAIVCTQVLLLVADPGAAAREMHRLLAPGGVLLLTLPQAALGVPREEFPTDYWRFTEDSVRLLLRPFADVRVTGHGNPLAVFAFASRIVVEELQRGDLDWTDPRFPLHLNAYARK